MADSHRGPAIVGNLVCFDRKSQLIFPLIPWIPANRIRGSMG